MTETKSAKPIVQAMSQSCAEAGAVAAARGLLPLPQDELIEVLVSLAGARRKRSRPPPPRRSATDGGRARLRRRLGRDLPAVLKYLAARPDSARETQEAPPQHADADEAVATLAGVTRDGAVLENLSINQQRMIARPPSSRRCSPTPRARPKPSGARARFSASSSRRSAASARSPTRCARAG